MRRVDSIKSKLFRNKALVRNGAKKKVGLALGGGAAKGMAHIGVLEVLEREGIPIDMIAGTSIGAIVGVFYAYTKDIPLMKTLAMEMGRKRARYLSDITIPRTGLIRLSRVEKLLKTVLDGAEFKDLQIPFACVAADMDSGDEVVLDHGFVWDAIRASATVPVIVSLSRIEGRNLLDGGLIDPVPVNIVRQMGADLVIAVNVTSAETKGPSTNPNLFSIMMKTIYIVGHQALFDALREADIVIEPKVGDIGFADFQRAEDCFLLGQLAAENMLPEIKHQLAID